VPNVFLGISFSSIRSLWLTNLRLIEENTEHLGVDQTFHQLWLADIYFDTNLIYVFWKTEKNHWSI